jgi:hypothetical protein
LCGKYPDNMKKEFEKLFEFFLSGSEVMEDGSDRKQ